MITLLVTISLLLHGVTFLWIMTLLQKQHPAQNVDIEKIKNEIEDLLISYTAEMKEGNELLLKQVQENSPQKNSTAVQIQDNEEKPISKTKKLEEIDHVNKRKIERKPKLKKERDVDYEEYKPPHIEIEEESSYEQSDSAKAMALSKQGLSIDEIAKKLSLGKGEVELMLKFYR